MLKQLVTVLRELVTVLKTAGRAVFGTRFDRELKKIQPLIDAIHEHEQRL